jgi:ABC-type antimicrobial peptide transport system permease subunit
MSSLRTFRSRADGTLPPQVLRLVIKEVLTLTLIGIALGVPTAIALAHLMNSPLYAAAKAHNFDVFFTAIVVVTLCATLAGLIPAYRASLLDPKQALRYE